MSTISPENETPDAATVDSATRREDRITFVTELFLETNRGVTLSGHTTDVSLSGAFLFTGYRPDTIQEGDTGVVTATVRGKDDRMFDMAFPCVVARVTERGVGLHFDEQEGDEDGDGS